MRLFIAAGILWGLLTGVAWTNTVHLIECTEVNFLGAACDDDEDAVKVIDDDVSDVSPPPPPLFTLQTMRPDTPPLLVKAYNDPTDANIDAYLDWEHRYVSQALAADARVQQRRQQRHRKP